MNVVYAYEQWSGSEPAIFLAGPSPRDVTHANWRPAALDILAEIFSGTVFVPLPRNGVWTDHYDSQVEWEIKHLDRADIIAFWIPRDADLPGYTTNVEFGLYVRSGKIVLGYPEGATKMRYLHKLADMHGVPVCSSLERTVSCSVDMLAVNQQGYGP